jgi:hypothetical protein
LGLEFEQIQKYASRCLFPPPEKVYTNAFQPSPQHDECRQEDALGALSATISNEYRST